MTFWQVRLFGNLEIHYKGFPAQTLKSSKAQELLCYLLLRRDEAQSRETLAGVLWGEYSTAESKKRLRQALWQIQCTLNSCAEVDNVSLLLVEAERIRVSSHTNLWLDVAVFEHVFATFQGVKGRELSRQDAQALREATSLYRGDLLESCYDDWCLFERERLQNAYLSMLDKLMAYCEVQGECDCGIGYGESILHYDRANERTHRRMMRLHYLCGNRTAAIRQYGRCVAALRDELHIEPEKYTSDLYNRIRAGGLRDTLPEPKRADESPVAQIETTIGVPNWPQDILARFMSVQSALAELQRQIQRDIRVIEMTFNSDY